MSLSPDVFHRTPEEAARRIALAFLEEACAACDRLAEDEDNDALHDFRVAIRRLRSTLRAWRKPLRGALAKEHARALRKLQRATGGGRDAEVALEWLGTQHASLSPAHRRGHDWLVGRLSDRLGSSMDHVRAEVRQAFGKVADDVRRRLAVTTVDSPLEGGRQAKRFGEAFAASARAHVQDLAGHLCAIDSIDDEEESHAARIRGKRLRYLVEPVAALVPEGREVVRQLKRLQDVLGELNDTRMLRDQLGAELEEASAERARRLYELLRADDQEQFRREIRRSERAGLLEIVRRLQARSRKLYDRLRKRWLDDGAASMVTAVEALARRVEQIVSATEEIERKYLLQGAPELPQHAQVREIEQGYLEGRQIEERIRRQRIGDAVRHVRTVKLGGGVRRLEFEEELDGATFAALWPLTEGRRVAKRRHVVEDGADVWEIDEFLDRDLWLAEIELDSPDREVVFPAWLEPCVVREVTETGEYRNRRLAM